MADSIEHNRCGYCYEEFSFMRDPRELPCNHSFCLECLEEDNEKNGVVSCPLCDNKYESVEAVDELPKMRQSIQEEGTATTSTSAPTCECDDCSNQLAVCYCLQCCRRICAVHAEHHSSMFKRSHSVVEISEYEEPARKRKQVMCPTHDMELSSGCDDCGRLACSNCEMHPATCTRQNSEHNFMPLSDLREEITVELDKLLQLANDKLTEICVIDKQIWSTLDKEDEKCMKKIKLIERICEKRIKQIIEESDNLKKRIRDYQKRLTNQIEVYNFELLSRKQQLEESRSKVRKHLRDSHVTELVKLRRELTDDLERQLTTLSYQLITEPVLVHETVSKNALNIELTNLPTSLTTISEELTTSNCFSVCHRRHGGVLVGQADGITLLRERMKPKKVVSNVLNSCAVEHEGCIYVSKNRGSCEIYRYLPDFSNPQVILLKPTISSAKAAAPQPTSYSAAFGGVASYSTVSSPNLLAVSDEFIVCSTEENKLTLYNTQSRQSTDAEVEDTPKALYFLPTGDLLVTSWLGDSDEDGVLTRYQVEDGKLTTVWRCEGLQDAYGVCESDGLIYVSTSTSKSIHILSLQGKILHKIEEEQLPERAGQISVRGDKLAVPGWDDERVYIFNINH